MSTAWLPPPPHRGTLRYPPPGRIPLPPLQREWLRWFLYGYFGVVHRFRAHGQHHVPETGPVIIASNHPSYYDPFLVAMTLRRKVTYMTWDAFMALPVLGSLATWLGAFPVSIDWATRRSLQAAISILRSGDALGIFPEGSRSVSGQLDAIKPGAARMALRNQVPIVPVSIRGAARCFGVRHTVPTPGPLSVVYHPAIIPPPIPPGGSKALRPIERAMTEQLEARIRSGLDPRDRL